MALAYVPSRASDAGPSPRRPDPNETYHPCCNCGCPVTVRESYACQGNDVCVSRICEDCKVTCGPCGLPVCGAHRTDISGETTCEICLAAAIEEGAEIAQEVSNA